MRLGRKLPGGGGSVMLAIEIIGVGLVLGLGIMFWRRGRRRNRQFLRVEIETQAD